MHVSNPFGIFPKLAMVAQSNTEHPPPQEPWAQLVAMTMAHWYAEILSNLHAISPGVYSQPNPRGKSPHQPTPYPRRPGTSLSVLDSGIGICSTS